MKIEAKMNNFINVDIICQRCHVKHTVCVRSSDYAYYKKGIKNVQNCFPYLTPGERELLISGLCNHCWEKLFAHYETD